MQDRNQFLTRKGQGRYRFVQYLAIMAIAPWLLLLTVSTVSLACSGEIEAAVLGVIVVLVHAALMALLIKALLSQQDAVEIANCLAQIQDAEVSAEWFDHQMGKPDSIAKVRKLIAKGYLCGVSVNAGKRALMLKNNQKKALVDKCQYCGASLPEQIGAQMYCAYCGNSIPME